MVANTQDKVIRDPLHGYVHVPLDLLSIVRLPHVRRLQFISQTANVRAAYPSLNGSRYEHALGTMHLAMKAWESGWKNFFGLPKVSPSVARASFQDEVYQAIQHADINDLDEYTKKYRRSSSQPNAEESFKNDFEKNIRNVVGICGLLHDVGHSPYSHLLEDLFLYYSDRVFPSSLAADYEDYTATVKDGGRPQFHEYASKKLLKSMTLEYREAFANVSIFLLEEVFSARSGYNWAHCLHSIIDGQIDVDRLDYVMRDSLRAGVESGSIDSERLLESIEIHQFPDLQWRIGFGTRAVSSVEGLLEQRVQYYRWVILHPSALAADTALKRAFAVLLSDAAPGKQNGPIIPDGTLDYINHWARSSSTRSFEVDDARVMELLRLKRKHLLVNSRSAQAARFEHYMKVGADIDTGYVAAWRNYGEFIAAINSSSERLVELMTKLGLSIADAFGGDVSIQDTRATLASDSQLIGILYELIVRSNVWADMLRQSDDSVVDIETAFENFLNENCPKVGGVEGIWIVAVRQKFSAILENEVLMWSRGQPDDWIKFAKLSPVHDALISSEQKRPLIWPFFIPSESHDDALDHTSVANAFLDKFFDLIQNIPRKG